MPRAQVSPFRDPWSDKVSDCLTRLSRLWIVEFTEESQVYSLYQKLTGPELTLVYIGQCVETNKLRRRMFADVEWGIR